MRPRRKSDKTTSRGKGSSLKKSLPLHSSTVVPIDTGKSSADSHSNLTESKSSKSIDLINENNIKNANEKSKDDLVKEINLLVLDKNYIAAIKMLSLIIESGNTSNKLEFLSIRADCLKVILCEN